MDWKTDSDVNELDNESYSSFQSNKSGKLFDRLELPIILIGACLLALVILFVIFIPKKNEMTIDDYKHIVSRLDQLEDKIETLSGKGIDIKEFDPSKNPVQYQQVINWIKSNAEVISATIKKVDEIEKKIQGVPALKTAADSKPVNKKKTFVLKPRSTPLPAVKPKPVEKPKQTIQVTDIKPLKKSNPVQVKPRKATVPEIKPDAKPVIDKKPEQKKAAVVPVVAVPETILKPKPIPAAKPSPAKPETYKYIFHRVEKGETLYRISVNYGISVQELQKLNDMKADDIMIDIDEELIVKKVKQ